MVGHPAKKPSMFVDGFLGFDWSIFVMRLD
jgi:hypothetical protein